MFNIFKRQHKNISPSDKTIQGGRYGIVFKIGNVNCIGSTCSYKELMQFQNDLNLLYNAKIISIASYESLE